MQLPTHNHSWYLHYESHYDGDDAQHHHHAVGDVGQVNRQQPQIGMVDEHEEQNEADKRAHEQQEPEEETLRRADAVHPAVLRVGHGDGPAGQHHFEAVFQVFVAEEPGQQVGDSHKSLEILRCQEVSVWISMADHHVCRRGEKVVPACSDTYLGFRPMCFHMT